jgi:hypothetical protein
MCSFGILDSVELTSGDDHHFVCNPAGVRPPV